MIAAIKSITGIGNENPPPAENKPVETSTTDVKNDTNQVELLGEGSYSCVFRPGIECSRKQLVSKKYITKIQKYKETSSHEVEIGKIVKKIPHYSRYFAPIIETCDVTIDMLNNDNEAKKCKFLDITAQNRTKTYESNRIRYIGEHTLAEYLLQEAKSIKQLENYFRKWINIHITLLNSVSKLNAVNVVHMDIKENNIMCKEKSGQPVLIDFGLSMDITNIDSPDFQAAAVFFSYAANYPPWCLDIAIITYMIHKTKNADIKQKELNAWKSESASVDAVKQVINEYVSGNLEKSGLFSADEMTEFIQKAETYYMPLIEGGMLNTPSWGDVYNELVKYNQSWDNYSTAFMFLQLLTQFGLQELTEKFPFMKQYVSVLNTVILSMPAERPTAANTCDELKKVVSNLTRQEKMELGEMLTNKYDVSGYKQISRKIMNSKLDTTKIDNINLTAKQRMLHHMKQRVRPAREQ